jgi:hypothetical protein
MLGYEATEDDAAPGEWIVLEMPDESTPTTPDATIARFYGENARRNAEKWSKYLEAERADPLGEPALTGAGKHSLGGWPLVLLVASVAGMGLLIYYGAFGAHPAHPAPVDLPAAKARP